MTQIDQTSVGRGRPPIPDNPPTIIPTTEQIIWAAGMFDSAGSAGTTLGLNTFVQIPLARNEWIADLLVQLFGGRIPPVVDQSGQTRYIWRVHRELAWSFLNMIEETSVLSPISRTLIHDTRVKEKAIGGEANPGQVVVPARTLSKKKVPVIVPKTDLLVEVDYDFDILMMYVENSEPDTVITYGLPDDTTLQRFVKDVESSPYRVAQQVELTVSLTRRPSAV